MSKQHQWQVLICTFLVQARHFRPNGNFEWFRRLLRLVSQPAVWLLTLQLQPTSNPIAAVLSTSSLSKLPLSQYVSG